MRSVSFDESLNKFIENDNDDSEDESDLLSPYKKYSHLLVSYHVKCQVCGQKIVVGEEGDYHPIIGKIICFPSLDNGCQKTYIQLRQFMDNLEKTIVLRQSTCNYKPEKRRCYLSWTKMG